MFIISEKFDKEMRSNYATLVEEKSDTMSHNAVHEFAENDFDKRRRRCTRFAMYILCFILTSLFVHHVFVSRGRLKNSRTGMIVDPSQRAYQLAMATIDDSRAAVRTINQKNLLLPEQNKRVAIDYLNGIQDMLKKRVEYSVNKISRLIRDGVQDIENEIAQFERSLSTLLDGVVDVTAHSIGNIKAYVKKVSVAKDASELEKIAQQIRDEITQMIRNFDDMFTYEGGHLNDIVHERVQNITDRIRTVLVADRKRFRNVLGLQMAFCYDISRQNYEISNNLHKILEAINELRKTADTVNVLSSTFAPIEEYPLLAEAKNALTVELNDTKTAFNSIMNKDDNFLSTTLKQLAYQKHTEMKDFVYQNYETVILSVLPAVRKVTRDLKIVKDSHWQQVTKVVQPALTDLSILLQTKEALIAKNSTEGGENATAASNFKFETLRSQMKNRFQEIAAKVNSFFESKQDYEGFELALVATMDEKLPLISTWSLQNYVPSDACPITVEFQTYLKGIMDRYLSRSTNLQVVPIVES